MKALILDGSHAEDEFTPRLKAALGQALAERGWQAETIVVRDQKIGNCAGDFFCWVRSPGMCNTADDNRLIAAKIANCDLLIYLTPVTFGGYSSALKRMVDHQIQNITPFFARVDGETHHAKRYARYPDFLALGWLPAPDPHSEAIFRHLARRNALNLYAQSAAAEVVYLSQSDDELSVALTGGLARIAAGRARIQAALPEFPAVSGVPVRKAVLLVGSPRVAKSSSLQLGGYLHEQLGAAGIETETFQIYTTLRSSQKMTRMLQAVNEADLVTLACPLYVDSLPAPVTEALERIAAHRAGQPTRGRLAVMINCGFPEADHNQTAIAICADFARQAGFEWAGALSLGGGQGLVNGMPLQELGGRASNVRLALEQTAVALAQGQSVPDEAARRMARPFIPPFLYLMMGGFGWKAAAKQYGVEKQLKARPYER
jgi:multimeric flavodoxin WrbA